jgi:hypothetical protein
MRGSSAGCSIIRLSRLRTICGAFKLSNTLRNIGGTAQRRHLLHAHSNDFCILTEALIAPGLRSDWQRNDTPHDRHQSSIKSCSVRNIALLIVSNVLRVSSRLLA